jgi:hypothetical protein
MERRLNPFGRAIPVGRSLGSGTARDTCEAERFALFCFCCSATRLILLSVFAASVCWAQNSSSAAPAGIPRDANEHRGALACQSPHCHLEFENGQIRVLRLTLRGGEALPAHDAPDTLLVCINECHVRMERPDRRIHDFHMDGGETRWIPAYTRSEKNLSGEPAEIVLVEMKRSNVELVNPK